MLKKVLFITPNPPKHLLGLIRTLQLEPVIIHPENNALSTADHLLKLICSDKEAIVMIDSYLDTGDMQLFREIVAKEKKGIGELRKKILTGRSLPTSVNLLRKLHTLDPATTIIFLTHRTTGPNVKQLLREQGSVAVFNDSIELKELINVIGEIVGSTGQMITEAKKVFGEFKILLNKLEKAFE